MATTQVSKGVIKDDEVTTAKIPDNAVTDDKIDRSTFGFRKNMITNGDMRIAQLGTTATGISGVSAKDRTCDRWSFYSGNGGTWTVAQNQTTNLDGFPNGFQCTCTTPDTPLGADDTVLFQQKFEGQELQHLLKGTGSTKTTTLSFWARGDDAKTFTVELEDHDNGRTIAKQFTLAGSGVWDYYSWTIPGDTTGAFNDDNALSLTINWWLCAGANLQSGTLGTSWGSRVTANRAVGNSNFADATNNYIEVSGVQWEVGNTATEFERLPYCDQLQRCQRNTIKLVNHGGASFHYGGGLQVNTTTSYIFIAPPTGFRGVTGSSTITTVGAFALNAWISGATYAVSAMGIIQTPENPNILSLQITHATGPAAPNEVYLIGNGTGNTQIIVNTPI